MTSQGLSYYRDSITPNLIDEFLDIDSNKQEFLRHSKKLEEKRIKEKIEEVTAETLIESDYFKSRKQKFNVKEGHFYYKQVLKRFEIHQIYMPSHNLLVDYHLSNS